jgi:galactonate dehydratase
MSRLPPLPSCPIALAACLQVDACAYNALIQEQSLGIRYNEGSDVLDYLADRRFRLRRRVRQPLPEKPGLGIEIDEKCSI